MLRALLLTFFLCAALTHSVFAQDDSFFETPAPHAIIMDYDTGLILFEKDARRPLPPASMTKIMTAEMIFQRLKDGRLTTDTEFTVSENAWRRGGAASGSSTMFLKPGSNVRVEDLLRGVIIQSGNDACIVLAEGISGSEAAFAEKMTERAKALGLETASFKNATGWPADGHHISFHDLARLSAITLETYPEYYPIYAETEFTWNNITQPNRNPLLGRFQGADGLKTGRTDEAGYSLVASAKRDGERRIVVVGGLNSQAQRRDVSEHLMNAAFNDFKLYNLFDANETVGQVPVYMGTEDHVNVVAPQAVKSALHKQDRAKLKTQLRYNGHAVAPIQAGDHIADLIISEPGKSERITPLVAAAAVKEKSAFGKAITVLIAIIRGEK